MNIISHRGLWGKPTEKNTNLAFRNSFVIGMGTETDIRDYLGALVISHDPAQTGAISFEDFLQLHLEHDADLPLALNVKADGLQKLVLEAFAKIQKPRNCFFFDMSIPDALAYLRCGLPIYTRHSDIELEPVLYDESVGVWLDSFGPDWVTERVIDGHLSAGKSVCLVSPELHGREHIAFWERLSGWPAGQHPGLTLCTDNPIEAREFFHEPN